jgi:hypothetical protein
MKENERGYGGYGGTSRGPEGPAGATVTEAFLWLAIAFPVLAAIAKHVIGARMGMLFFGLSLAILVVDWLQVKKVVGDDAPSPLWAILVPVYFWKRATVLGQTKHHMVFLAASVAIAVFLSFHLREIRMATASCAVVTATLQDHGGSEACESVIIDKKVSRKHYEGTALLDSGRQVSLTIDVSGFDAFDVTILNAHAQ